MTVKDAGTLSDLANIKQNVTKAYQYARDMRDVYIVKTEEAKKNPPLCEAYCFAAERMDILLDYLALSMTDIELAEEGTQGPDLGL